MEYALAALLFGALVGFLLGGVCSAFMKDEDIEWPGPRVRHRGSGVSYRRRGTATAADGSGAFAILERSDGVREIWELAQVDAEFEAVEPDGAGLMVPHG